MKFCGGLKSRQAAGQLAEIQKVFAGSEIIDFTSDIAEVAATIHADLERRGQLSDHPDLLIAATAITNGSLLATNNI